MLLLLLLLLLLQVLVLMRLLMLPLSPKDTPSVRTKCLPAFFVGYTKS